MGFNNKGSLFSMKKKVGMDFRSAVRKAIAEHEIVADLDGDAQSAFEDAEEARQAREDARIVRTAAPGSMPHREAVVRQMHRLVPGPRYVRIG